MAMVSLHSLIDISRLSCNCRTAFMMSRHSFLACCTQVIWLEVAGAIPKMPYMFNNTVNAVHIANKQQGMSALDYLFRNLVFPNDLAG